MELWTLRLEMYYDWAYDNGACDLIGIFEDVDMAIEVLEGCLKVEVEEEHIIGNGEPINEIIELCKENPNHFGIPVYASIYAYDMGNEQGYYKIEKKILNDTGYVA